MNSKFFFNFNIYINNLAIFFILLTIFLNPFLILINIYLKSFNIFQDTNYPAIFIRLLYTLIMLCILYKLPKKRSDLNILYLILLNLIFSLKILIEDKFNFFSQPINIQDYKILLINFFNCSLILFFMMNRKFDFDVNKLNNIIFKFCKIYILLLTVILVVKYFNQDLIIPDTFITILNFKLSYLHKINLVNAHSVGLVITIFLILLLENLINEKNIKKFDLAIFLLSIIITIVFHLSIIFLTLLIYLFLKILYFKNYRKPFLFCLKILIIFLLFLFQEFIMTSIFSRLKIIIQNFNEFLMYDIFFGKKISLDWSQYNHNLFLDIFNNLGFFGLIIFIKLFYSTFLSNQKYNFLFNNYKNFILIVLIYVFYSLLIGFYFMNTSLIILIAVSSILGKKIKN